MKNNLNKEYLYEYQKLRWRKRKIDAILYKGGQCSRCGIKYDGHNGCIFDFHHINPKEKSYDWNKLRLRKWEDIKKELDKEVCLCANCHRIVHSEDF